MAHKKTIDEPYSTLEVSHTYADHSQKEVVRTDGGNLPQVVYDQAPQYYKSNGADGRHYYAANERDGADGLQYYEDAPPQASKNGPRRRCGLAPRAFWIVVTLVSTIVFAAIAGGVAGGMLSVPHRSSSGQVAGNTGGGSSSGGGGSSNSTSNSTSPVTLLATSKVAAVNWTDTGRFSHYAVFSQDSTNSVMISLWDSQNQTWSTVNISQALAGNGNPIKVKPGSPLSAVATGPPDWVFQMNLYYLTPSNNVGEIYCKDMAGNNWAIGDFSKSPKVADDNSPLASAWPRCDAGCTNVIMVTYLSASTVVLVNGTQSTALVNVDSGSPLSMFPLVGLGGGVSKTQQEGQPWNIRLYIAQAGALNEYKYSGDRVDTQGWGYGTQMFALSLLEDGMLTFHVGFQVGKIPTNPLPQVAGAPFNSWLESTVLVLNSDGSLTGNWWDNSTWTTNQHMNLLGGQTGPAFKAIALHHERRMYAVTNGTIQEYRFEVSDPSTLIYVGKIGLATD